MNDTQEKEQYVVQQLYNLSGQGGKGRRVNYTDWSVGTMPCTAVISGTLPGGSFGFVLGATTLL